MNAEFPEKLQFLFEPHRYKVPFGGRGGAKSWGIARALLIIGTKPEILWPGRTDGPRVLCARETQKSIGDSVHKLLSDQIVELGLQHLYTVQKSTITARNGAQFIFAGIKQNITNIKSYEACDICWVEEAQTVSRHSWEILIPTIRKEGSEIWVSFNPELKTDETYRRFVLQPPPNAKVVKLTYADNPWFPEVLRQEMEHLKATNPDMYEHVWEGMCKQVVEGCIFRNELLTADKEERICRVPYDATKPVHTFWDLGFGDHTSIWFTQCIGFEFRLIDFLDGSQQGLQYYLQALQSKGYVYGTDYLPHDAKAHELGSGRTIEEQMKAAGRKVQVVPKLSLVDGIAAARAIFGRCWFDRERCADGIQALRHYRYPVNEKLGTLDAQPLHDWASHPADAFRYFAVAIREPERQKQEKRKKAAAHISAWS